MKLIADANVLFSFFKKDSSTRRFILSHPELELFTSVYVLEELDKHSEEILSKSKIDNRVFELIKRELLEYITPISLDKFKGFWNEAQRISPDPDDVVYFAMALARGCAIWSNDKAFKEQSAVKVLSTTDIIELFGL